MKDSDQSRSISGSSLQYSVQNSILCMPLFFMYLPPLSLVFVVGEFVRERGMGR